MRFFYRLVEGLPVLQVVNFVHVHDRFTPTSVPGVADIMVRDGIKDTQGAKDVPAFKKLSLAVLQMVDGSSLGRSICLRIDSKVSLPLGNPTLDHAGYLMVLHALPKAMVMAGDETVMVKTGDVWWADMRQDAQLINNSEDDMIVLLVDVRIDP